jgi:hypothetical protein
MKASDRNKAMKAALQEALDLFGHEFCYRDGQVIVMREQISTGSMWVMSARVALGLDPATGKRLRVPPAAPARRGGDDDRP